MARIIKADGTHTDIVGAGVDGRLTLEQMQEAVGGYIEPVPGSGLTAFCNEDGRQLELRPNLNASIFFGQELLGDVIVLTDREVELAKSEE